MTLRQARVVLVVATVLAIGLVVFRAATSSGASTKTAPLRTRVAKLEHRVNALETQIKKLQKVVCPQFPPVCIKTKGKP